MCNCKAPYNKMYNAYKKAAAETCAAYPEGTPGKLIWNKINNMK